MTLHPTSISVTDIPCHQSEHDELSKQSTRQSGQPQHRHHALIGRPKRRPKPGTAARSGDNVTCPAVWAPARTPKVHETLRRLPRRTGRSHPHVLGFSPTESIVFLPIRADLPATGIDLPTTAPEPNLAWRSINGALSRNAHTGTSVTIDCVSADANTPQQRHVSRMPIGSAATKPQPGVPAIKNRNTNRKNTGLTAEEGLWTRKGWAGRSH